MTPQDQECREAFEKWFALQADNYFDYHCWLAWQAAWNQCHNARVDEDFTCIHGVRFDHVNCQQCGNTPTVKGRTSQSLPGLYSGEPVPCRECDGQGWVVVVGTNLKGEPEQQQERCSHCYSSGYELFRSTPPQQEPSGEVLEMPHINDCREALNALCAAYYNHGVHSARNKSPDERTEHLARAMDCKLRVAQIIGHLRSHKEAL